MSFQNKTIEEEERENLDCAMEKRFGPCNNALARRNWSGGIDCIKYSETGYNLCNNYKRVPGHIGYNCLIRERCKSYSPWSELDIDCCHKSGADECSNFIEKPFIPDCELPD